MGAASAQPGEPSRAESVRTGAAPAGGRSSSSDDAARSSAGAPEASNPGSNPKARREDLPPLSPAEAGAVPGPPPSWVPKLVVPRQLVDLRCPRGAKTVLYTRAQLELFAWFGECARWDGMVQRATLYEARTRRAARRAIFDPTSLTVTLGRHGAARHAVRGAHQTRCPPCHIQPYILDFYAGTAWCSAPRRTRSTADAA